MRRPQSVLLLVLALSFTTSIQAEALKGGAPKPSAQVPTKAPVGVPSKVTLPVKGGAPIVNPVKGADATGMSAVASAGTDPMNEAMRACASCAGADVQKNVKGNVSP